VLSVKNPWQGAENVEMSLFLSRGGELPPAGFEGPVVEAPLKNVVCMSSSYVAFIDAIGRVDVVRGVSGAQYIFNDSVRARYDAGLVRDVGYDSNLDFEAIAALNPDLVMMYGLYGDNTAVTRKFDELGIKYIYIGDYVEQSPLGKAEWLVAMGEMLGEREKAEELFRSVERSYAETVDEIARHVKLLSSNTPKVMLNAPYRDTWFVPGDRNYMVRLIGDAGGDYVCAGVDSDKSRPISGESAYIFASRADVWLNPGQASTRAQLLAENPRFAEIPPVLSGRVFNCIARSTPGGGSDFWESGAVRPDIVLKDIVRIFYPDVLPEHELYYFRRVE
jgi:iron complex transport system substrate-binding protein